MDFKLDSTLFVVDFHVSTNALIVVLSLITLIVVCSIINRGHEQKA